MNKKLEEEIRLIIKKYTSPDMLAFAHGINPVPTQIRTKEDYDNLVTDIANLKPEYERDRIVEILDKYIEGYNFVDPKIGKIDDVKIIGREEYFNQIATQIIGDDK